MAEPPERENDNHLNGRSESARISANVAALSAVEQRVSSLERKEGKDILALQHGLRGLEVLLSEMAGTDPTPGLSWAAKEQLKSDHHFWQLERKENSLEWKRRAALKLAVQSTIAGALAGSIVTWLLTHLVDLHV